MTRFSVHRTRFTRITVTAAVLLLILWGIAWAAWDIPSNDRPTAIDDEVRVDAGDADLYLLVRGADGDAPLMLWLHGGPGGAETPLFRLYAGRLEDRFLVAYWDQRGAGRSYDPGADAAQLTIARHVADLKTVVDHLRARYRQRKVALVGHSWGSALGLLYAQKYPEDVSIVVGVNQFVSGLGAQQGQYAFVRSSAERNRDAKTLRQLGRIGKPPLSSSEELQLQRLVDRYGGLFHQKPDFAKAMIQVALRGYAAPWVIPSFIRANEISLAAMEREITALDLTRSVQAVEVPVVFMLGRYDRQLEARQAARYFEGLSAPDKTLIWFDKAAHNIPFERPERFMAVLKNVIEEANPPPPTRE